MAEQQAEQAETTEAATAGGAEPQGAETNWKAEARKWEERAKANKAKADQWDAQEEAGKTELQKATERADKLKAELDGIRAAEKLKAEVADAAERHGVDADLLSRMSGDVEENAKFLSERFPKRSYPQTRDRGERGKTKSGDGVAQAARMLFGNH